MEVWDEDVKYHDYIGTTNFRFRGITPDRSYSDHSFRAGELTMQVRLTCEPNYGGVDCDKHCIPPTNGYGDFNLASPPYYQCNFGWRGSGCSQSKCPPCLLFWITVTNWFYYCQNLMHASSSPWCNVLTYLVIYSVWYHSTVYCPTENNLCGNKALCADDGCGYGSCVSDYSSDGRRCTCYSGWTSATCELGKYDKWVFYCTSKTSV